MALAGQAWAQPVRPEPGPVRPEPGPVRPEPGRPDGQPAPEPAESPRLERYDHAPNLPAPAEPPPPPPPSPEALPPKAELRSEGRILVNRYNAGFQWSISPGIAVGDQSGFVLGLRAGY